MVEANRVNRNIRIGDVFTPAQWAEFAVTRFHIYEQWINGAKIFDPTMGTGSLLEALVHHGLAQGKSLHSLPVENLFGNELNLFYYQTALNNFRENLGIDMSSNFTNEDLIDLPPREFDVLLGNPPWVNYVDLPEEYKQKIKNSFIEYGLADNRGQLLLGNSRIDFAALIIQVAMRNFLAPEGQAVFFAPLSLLLNDGANRKFRTFRVDEVPFALEQVFDFNGKKIFPGISTRYGLMHFTKNKKSTYPLSYHILENNCWKEYYAKPMFKPTDPLSVFSSVSDDMHLKIKPINIRKESVPRQGINTCGANDIFYFDECLQENDHTVIVTNKVKNKIQLPADFIYPVVTSRNFNRVSPNPGRFILLPYQNSGKILTAEQISAYPELNNYLSAHKQQLSERKGVMLRTMIDRGYWWALLGVGKYCFYPCKIIWEAYGKQTFRPILTKGRWQANQSLQAYIPVKEAREADRILKQLQDKNIEKYLLSLRMAGTMNWAQPGKIRKILQITDL